MLDSSPLAELCCHEPHLLLSFDLLSQSKAQNPACCEERHDDGRRALRLTDLTSQQELQFLHFNINNRLAVCKCSNLQFVSSVDLWIAHRLALKKYRYRFQDEPGR